MTPVGGEKENNKRPVEKVEYDEEEQLLIVMIGGNPKDKHVRLIPTAALDGRDLKWIKVNETKGCHLMCVGSGSNSTNRLHRRTEPSGMPLPMSTNPNANVSPPHFFAVAIQKSVVIFEINRIERRHHKLRELAMPGQPQTLKISGGRLYVGYMSGFRIWDLVDNTQTCKSKIFITTNISQFF